MTHSRFGQHLYQAPKIPTLTPVLAGLDPAIGYPQPIANGAIPISNQPMTMTGSGPVMTWLDRCVGYVNSKGGWYYHSVAWPEYRRRVREQPERSTYRNGGFG
jgi:hypothetical protein